MTRAGGAALIVAISLASAACSLIPPEIACNRVDPSTCQRIAQQVISRKTAEDGARRVVRIEIMDERGSYTLTFDDGSGESMIVD